MFLLAQRTKRSRGECIYREIQRRIYIKAQDCKVGYAVARSRGSDRLEKKDLNGDPPPLP